MLPGDGSGCGGSWDLNYSVTTSRPQLRLSGRSPRARQAQAPYSEFWERFGDMAGYNYNVIRATIFGDAFSGAEEWSTGFWLGHAEAVSGLPTQEAADAIRALWQTFFTSAGANISNVYTTVGVKLSYFPSGSDKVDPAMTVFSYYGTPITGSRTGTPQLPPQIAVVATLQSALPRGLAGKGRMYLPGSHMGLDASGQMDSTAKAGLLSAFSTFVQGVNNSTAMTAEVINASKGRIGVPFNPPVNQYVRSVRIGSVYDTQRRRRNGLTENYGSTAITSGP